MSGTGESTPMTANRVRRLESLGFKWSTKDPRHVPWEQRYEELVDFKVKLELCFNYFALLSALMEVPFVTLQNKFGHAQVPIGWEVRTHSSSVTT